MRGAGDLRLRFDLSNPAPATGTPDGFVLRGFLPDDARAVHALLVLVFGDEEPEFDRWWESRSGDGEYDPAVSFVTTDADGTIVGAAWCWTSGFLKDLAVAPSARRKGLGEALCGAVFEAFRARGLAHVDLKTNLVESAEAVRLYRRLGMVEVDWAG